ncbi:MAG: hypothetical protein IKD73_06175 [Selenomonadaceae bacterium]|nr:hypothetical protein [Selenomonadaceae bacterium]
MKATTKFTVDVSLLHDFNETLRRNNAYPDEVIEEFIKAYVNDSSINKIGGGDEKLTGNELTEKLLKNCKDYKVGELVRVVLRKLLEVGVASEDEILEMRKASGRAPLNTYRTSFGRYNKENFDTTFPLLITEQQKRDYDQNVPKFLVTPLNIRGESFHLSAQWYTHNRKPIEDWIRSHLPKWFERATEEQKSEMKSFIKTR